VKGPRGGYGKFKGVDSEQDVYDFTARWAAQEELNVRPSLITLLLVRCAGEEPTAEEEAAATVLIPRRTLRAAGVADGGSLLATVAGACNTAARAVACAHAACRCKCYPPDTCVSLSRGAACAAGHGDVAAAPGSCGGRHALARVTCM
jgi:hypothetical protein